MTNSTWLRVLALLTLVVGAVGAAAGLFWTQPGEMPPHPDLYGRGLYRRDTPFNAGGAQGADIATLLLILPAALWALAGPLTGPRRTILAPTLSWLLYLGVSLSFGAIAFDEAFPLYVLLIPLAAFGLLLMLRDAGLAAPSRWLPAFLLVAGLVTALAWSLLLWLEMAAGTYPPQTYDTVRTTYALDLGLIAPGCIAAAVGIWNGRRWAVALAVPLLSIAALLLPMMVAQTVMQLRAGVAFGPEALAPFVGFSVLSPAAVCFLWRLAAPVAPASARDRHGGPHAV